MITAALAILGLMLADQAWIRRKVSARAAVALLAGSAMCLVGAALALPGWLYAQKIVGLLLMPIGMLWSLIFVGAVVARMRGRNDMAAALLAAFVGLGIAANPWLGRTLLATLESPYAAVDPFAEDPFDVVFVLGGGTSLDGAGNPILGGSGDRVMLAARLWHAGKAKHLVPSGSSIAGIGKARDVADETERIWASVAVPDESVTPLPAPRNTSEEISAYADLARERGWQRVGLVTSAWHMRRAQRLADRHGLTVTPLPADFRGSYGFDGAISFVPSGFGARDMHRAGWEYLGALVGR